MKFKKDKEYIILIKTNKTVRIVVSKTTTLDDGSQDVVSKDCMSGWDFKFNSNKLNCIRVIEPINNTEIFSMYINWNNFNQKGVHQNLILAKEIQQSIFNTLVSRSFVKQGSSKLETYDLSLIEKILPGIPLENFYLHC